MHNQINDTKKNELAERLRKLSLKTPPPQLTDQVMSRLSRKNPSLFNRLQNFLHTSTTISFKPVYALCLIVLIGSAFLLGRGSIQTLDIKTAPQLSLTAPFDSSTNNAQVAYLRGRTLLESNNVSQALQFFQKARFIEPGNSEFAYWQGISHWMLGDLHQERSVYIQGLDAAPENIPLLVNLGHNYLSQQEYTKALQTYQKALKLSPTEKSALYNQGLIYQELNNPEKELSSLQAYLKHYRTGQKAFNAVKRLNKYGDYSYRLYRIGARLVILSQEIVLDTSTAEYFRQQELLPLANFLRFNKKAHLEMVVFVDGDNIKAKKKALELKRLLKNTCSEDAYNRIDVSWFGTSEKITSTNANINTLDEGLLLFTHLPPNTEKETAI